jgi:hypothetical protein
LLAGSQLLWIATIQYLSACLLKPKIGPPLIPLMSSSGKSPFILPIKRG